MPGHKFLPKHIIYNQIYLLTDSIENYRSKSAMDKKNSHFFNHVYTLKHVKKRKFLFILQNFCKRLNLIYFVVRYFVVQQFSENLVSIKKPSIYQRPLIHHKGIWYNLNTIQLSHIVSRGWDIGTTVIWIEFWLNTEQNPFKSCPTWAIVAQAPIFLNSWV